MKNVVASSGHSLLTRKEAAQKLRISLFTLDKLISSNKLPSITIGRKRLIEKDQFESFIQKGGSK